MPNVYDPQSLNRFAYARNNPLKYTDPDGHFIFCAAAIAIGAKYTGLMALGDLAVMGAIAYGISHQITVDKKIPNDDLLAPPSKRGNAPIGKDGHPVELRRLGVGPSWIHNRCGFRSKTGLFLCLKAMFLGPKNAV